MRENVIDQSVLDSLKETVGSDFVPELVAAFLEEAPALIAQLRTALLAGDKETFRRSAHSLKSNAATFGAVRMFELAREMEALARENQLVEVGDRIKVLEDAFDQAAEALMELST